MKRCVLSLEQNIDREDEFRVSGGSEFQSRGPMTEKALLPSDDTIQVIQRQFHQYKLYNDNDVASSFILSGYTHYVVLLVIKAANFCATV